MLRRPCVGPLRGISFNFIVVFNKIDVAFSHDSMGKMRRVASQRNAAWRTRALDGHLTMVFRSIMSGNIREKIADVAKAGAAFIPITGVMRSLFPAIA